jgi:orotidine-5'-phosphate decarboxylase
MSFEESNMPKIIVALDCDDEEKALSIAKKLSPKLCALKVGLELFVSYGPNIIKKLHHLGYKIFLDLKFHDINTTAIKSSVAAAKLGVWMMNIHSSGGTNMMKNVMNEIKQNNFDTLVLGVTILTSLDDKDIKEIGYANNVKEQVLSMTDQCYHSNLNGVVCSASEAKAIKEKYPKNFICVCPGIRLSENNNNDQKRIVTPEIAAKNGADYIVVGRPVLDSIDPLASLKNIKDKFYKAL